MPNEKTTTIRIKFSVRDAVKKAAKKDGRTLEAFVERLINAALTTQK